MKELPINQIIQGDCLEVLKTLPDNYVDSIVTDPPYGLSFMGKKWDYDVPSVEVWQECLRVLKPGGHLLSFSGTRTYHRMACAIEDAGFEVRDMIEWVYGSGFPKSLNIGKAVDKLQDRGFDEVCELGRHIKECRESKNISRKEVNEKFNAVAICNHWEAQDRNNALPPTVEHWEILKNYLGCSDRFDFIVERIGKEREKIGLQKKAMSGWNMDGTTQFKDRDITKGISEWEGWGTALKPSHETIAVAQKPFDSRSDIDYTVSICQTLFAQIVKNSSELNLNENTQQSIAQWIAEKNINTLEDLSEVMDMLQSELETNLNLNIVLSWLNILGEIWGAMSMFTTETKGSLTTELKILQSLEWENIFQNITQVKNNQIDGYSANVLNVENLLNAVKLKLKYILTHSAQENAISQANKLNFAPNHEPICMARKPLGEKTVAENVLKYGTGGINIDESRVDGKTEIHSNGKRSMYGGNSLFESKTHNSKTEVKDYGRFPANLIHDGSDEVKECFPDTKVGARKAGQLRHTKEGDLNFTGNTYTVNDYPANEGNASRFFKSIITDKLCTLCCLPFNIKHDTMNVCKNTNVSSAEKSFKTTQATTESTALKNATGQVNKNLVQNVKSAGNLCDLCGTSIAQRLVAIMQDPSQESTLGVLSMPEHKKQILEKCLVSFVELRGNTDTIPTMENLSLLFGYVSNAIEEYTQKCEDIRNEEKNQWKSLVYRSKASKSERNRGCEGLEEKETEYKGFGLPDLRMKNLQNRIPNPNNHPTVKPIALMEYLIKMVTPKGGIVLDPFTGSGTTLVAAKQNRFQYIGVEITPEYIKIVNARLNGIKDRLIYR